MRDVYMGLAPLFATILAFKYINKNFIITLLPLLFYPPSSGGFLKAFSTI
jgi:hypothetical protein